MKLSLPKLPQFELPTELRVPQGTLPFDPLLLISTLALMLTGLVMISSASMDVAAENFGGAFFFIFRHGFFVLLAIAVAMVVVRIPIHIWERFSVWLLVIGFLLLVVVLIPGIGREVNGSRRWIGLGGMNA